ncbi:hypothetical protein GW17_00044069 [Ensete ventricosum]|nr:hypothetical protein GW17_00044069 [Ensete ventricosum]
MPIDRRDRSRPLGRKRRRGGDRLLPQQPGPHPLIPIPTLLGLLALFPRLPHPSFPTPTAPFRVIGTSTATELCDPLMPAGRKEVDVVMQNDMKFPGLKNFFLSPYRRRKRRGDVLNAGSCVSVQFKDPSFFSFELRLLNSSLEYCLDAFLQSVPAFIIVANSS